MHNRIKFLGFLFKTELTSEKIINQLDKFNVITNIKEFYVIAFLEYWNVAYNEK